jgi:8-oxo-dGTP pyrophosphatase MutT (NUDIX family)
MSIVEREVGFAPGAPSEMYHSVEQQDYIAIVARTPDGRFPVVRQYRPAVEAFTWELPAGLVERSEDPAEGCRRELLEETGFPARAVHALGVPAAACTGRLSNRIHSFFVEAGERVAGFVPEPGLNVEFVSDADLVGMIRAGTFTHQLHLGALLLAELRGFIALPR